MHWVLAILSTVAAALVGGVFYAFSTFVMQALADLAPADGNRAMQRINVRVIHPWFLVPFFGAAVLPALAALIAFSAGQGAAGAWLLAAAVIYIGGSVGVTMARNVPLNLRLDRLGTNGPEATQYWAVYVPRWLFWNHVRAVASLLAAVCSAAALLVSR